MNSEGNHRPAVFKLDYSGPVLKTIQDLLKTADLPGGNQKVKAALAIILRRLIRDPLNFGELVRVYKHIKLFEHVAVVAPLVVTFGIDEEHRFVVIKSVRILESGASHE